MFKIEQISICVSVARYICVMKLPPRDIAMVPDVALEMWSYLRLNLVIMDLMAIAFPGIAKALCGGHVKTTLM